MHKKLLSTIFFSLLLFMPHANTVTFSSDSMRGKAGESGTTVLSGNATVSNDEFSIKGDSIELSGKDFSYIVAFGNVSGENTKSHFSFSADKITYDRTKRIIEFYGSVSLIDTQNDTTITSDYAQFQEETEILNLKFNVRITQKDKICTALFATYTRKISLVDLAGKPQVINGTDTFRAERISIQLDTEEISLQGKVSGSLEQKE